MLQPVFAQWIQNTHFLAPNLTAPNALASTSVTWGGDLVAVGGKVAMMPISLGTADFMVLLNLEQGNVCFEYIVQILVVTEYQHQKTYLVVFLKHSLYHCEYINQSYESLRKYKPNLNEK